MKIKAGILVTLILIITTVSAQVGLNRSGELVRLTMSDGTRVTGRIEMVTPESVQLFTAYFGLVDLPQKEITSVKYLSDYSTSDSVYNMVNPNASRHFFSPTAIPLHKREGYYQNFYVAFNMLNWGLTDHFSMGIAAVPFVWFIEDGFNLLLTAKYGYPIADKLHIGTGLIAGILPAEAYGGIGYGLITYGSKNSNITAGAGYGYLITDYSSPEYQDEEKTVVLNLAGMVRLSEHIGLVSENWYFTQQDLLLISYGGRYIGDKISIDVGFVNSPEIIEDIPTGIPLLGVVIYL